MSVDAISDAALRPTPVLATTDQLCKLLSHRNTSDPTANDVQHRANILGADLGIPVEHAGTLYIMFGDTIGFAGIWGAQSHPDSVGYGIDSAAAIAANPSLLCAGTRIVSLAPSASIGPSVNASVQRDFAGVYMAPPPNHSIGEYIRNPSGGNGGPVFPNLPGDFEVPSGAFSTGGSIYVFYTTVVGPNDITMKGSYLARWTAPSPTAIPAFDILYARRPALRQRRSARRALHQYRRSSRTVRTSTCSAPATTARARCTSRASGSTRSRRPASRHSMRRAGRGTRTRRPRRRSSRRPATARPRCVTSPRSIAGCFSPRS